MSDPRRNTTLAILAGGEGTRMGRAKALLTVNGQPILKHILAAARWPGPTLLITAPGRESPPGADAFDAEATDPVAGLGPMRGLLTAIEQATTEQIIVAPVDMPALGAEVFGWLVTELNRRPVAIALMIERMRRGDWMLEPLPAAFRIGARDLIQQRLVQEQASLRGLAQCHGVQVVRAPDDWPAKVWTNWNYPQDVPDH